MTESKNGSILINSLRLKIRSVNLLSKHKPTIKTTRVKASSAVEFIFSKVICFLQILLNSSRQMRLKYEKQFLRGILFLYIQVTLTQLPQIQTLHYKNVQTREHIKDESCNSYLVKQCFQLLVDWTLTLILRTHFLHTRSGALVKLRVRNIGPDELNFSGSQMIIS